MADKLLPELQELMAVCQENLYHAQELQKWAYNKSVKLSTNVPNDKV